MSLFVKKLAGMAVRKLASDPEARKKAMDAAQRVAREAKTVVHSENKAYQAGRSARRLIDSFKRN